MLGLQAIHTADAESRRVVAQRTRPAVPTIGSRGSGLVAGRNPGINRNTHGKSPFWVREEGASSGAAKIQENQGPAEAECFSPKASQCHSPPCQNGPRQA
jgi:hypothetical protein